MLTLITCPLDPRDTVVEHKRPGHFLKSTGSQTRLTMPLSRQNLQIYQRTISQETRQETFRHNRLTSLTLSQLILAELVRAS